MKKLFNILISFLLIFFISINISYSDLTVKQGYEYTKGKILRLDKGEEYIKLIDEFIDGKSDDIKFLIGLLVKADTYIKENKLNTKKDKKDLLYKYIKYKLILFFNEISYKANRNSGNDTIKNNKYLIDIYDNLIKSNPKELKIKKVLNFWNKNMFFADPKFNRIVDIDLDKVKGCPIPLIGRNPHSVDRAGFTDKMYVRTQDSKSFDVINAKNGTFLKTVFLSFKPRAVSSYNKYLDLQLVTGKDDPKMALIRVKDDSVIKTVGKNRDIEIDSKGGTSATGHGKWLDEKHFVILDRVHKELAVYKVEKKGGEYIVSAPSILKMPGSTHGLITIPNSTENEKNIFYADIEGNKNSKQLPGIAELKFINGKLKINRIILLGKNYDTNIHHPGITPDKKFLYAGTGDGYVYIIDLKKFKVIKTIFAGKGVGHFLFSKKYNLAISTNHFSTYLSIFDTKNNKLIKNIQVSESDFDPNHPHLLQAHNNTISINEDYYLGAAAKDGIFFILDLKNLNIIKKIYTKGELEQSFSY